MQKITEEKLQGYIDITKEALEKVKITKNKKLIMKANELLNLSICYYF